MEKIPDKIMVLTITDSRNYPNHFWEEPLKKNCKELIWINLQKFYFDYGKTKTHLELLDIFKKEKPDYIFIFDTLFYDLDILMLFTKLRLISPKTKTVLFSGDDDIRFDFTRYLALFFDYIFIAHIDFLSRYKKDGFKNVSHIVQTKKPKENFSNKKIYDVSFIGTPKADRKEIIEYLYKNKINLSLFGYNWWNYPQLKEIYKGICPSKDQLKIISQTKINLDFSKNKFGVPHLNDRFFAISACKAFTLVQYSPYLDNLFEEEKEIIFFRTKRDLLKKIKYYLKHEKEREKIAEAAYKKVNLKFDLEKNITKFIKKTHKISPKNSLPKLEYSVTNIDENIIKLPREKIIKKIKNSNYISFSKAKIKKSPFKGYLQVYSLKKTKKPVSCCDYFISSNFIRNYTTFRYCQIGKLDKEHQLLLNINQIVMTKEFFLKNLKKIRRVYKTGIIDFIDDKNTAFVSIPLVEIKDFRKDFFDNPEFFKEQGFFLFSFHRKLYLYRKKPLKLLIYFILLANEGLSGKKFIFYQLINKFKDKNIQNILFNVK